MLTAIVGNINGKLGPPFHTYSIKNVFGLLFARRGFVSTSTTSAFDLATALVTFVDQFFSTSVGIVFVVGAYQSKAGCGELDEGPWMVPTACPAGSGSRCHEPYHPKGAYEFQLRLAFRAPLTDQVPLTRVTRFVWALFVNDLGAYSSYLTAWPSIVGRTPFEHSNLIISQALSRRDSSRRSAGDGSVTLNPSLHFRVRFSPFRPIAVTGGPDGSGRQLILSDRSVSSRVASRDICSSLRATFSYFTPVVRPVDGRLKFANLSNSAISARISSPLRARTSSA